MKRPALKKNKPSLRNQKQQSSSEAAAMQGAAAIQASRRGEKRNRAVSSLSTSPGGASMQQRMQRNGVIVGLLSLGVLATVALTAGPAQAQTTSVWPDYATPSWNQTLPSTTRFIILSNFAGAAVLDQNTGLVWEKSPQTVTATWNGARFNCINKNVGGQKGWRLPSIPELASLIDPSVAPPGPTLPSGHPFSDVQSAGYWSATTSAEDRSDAWFVYFGIGFVDSDSKTHTGHAWCVRGSTNADAY